MVLSLWLRKEAEKMKIKVINVKNVEFIKKVKKIVDEKQFIRQKIKEGKFKEIKSDIKFARPV